MMLMSKKYAETVLRYPELLVTMVVIEAIGFLLRLPAAVMS